MSFALFREQGAQIVPLPGAVGPWMADALSGSSIGALIAALAERIPAPCSMLAARFSIEFLRPVPMRPLDGDTSAVRQGRKQQVSRIRLSADGKEVVAATVLRLRIDPGASH